MESPLQIDTEICYFTNSNLKQSPQNKAYRNWITDCQEVYCNKVKSDTVIQISL